MNSNFKVIGLTRLRVKPKSTVPEAGAFTTRPSALLNITDLQGASLTCTKNNRHACYEMGSLTIQAKNRAVQSCEANFNRVSVVRTPVIGLFCSFSELKQLHYD